MPSHSYPDDEPVANVPGCTFTEREQSSIRAAWKSAAEILLNMSVAGPLRVTSDEADSPRIIR